MFFTKNPNLNLLFFWGGEDGAGSGVWLCPWQAQLMTI